MKKQIRYINKKTLNCRLSDRSTNFIAPDLITGCAYKCAYCYMRRNKPYGIDVAKNPQDIINSISAHIETLKWPKQPDQTHTQYWTYDIGCNTDVALHYKHSEYFNLFEFFKNHPKAFGSFATKRVNLNLLKYNPNRKLRIRFSVMPEPFRQILEPNTSTIIERLEAVKLFYEAGWDVHLNFSPVIAYNKSSELYVELFKLINEMIPDNIKPYIKSEVIFLTHDQKMHEYNLTHNPKAEELLWQPQFQEIKKSTYGGYVLRYNYIIKNQMINKFKTLHSTYIPWNSIRYIF
jgi:spore photoproduct lyase